MRSHARFRKSGLYLVELLVTLIVGVLLATMLVGSLSMIKRAHSTGHNEFLAAGIAHELLETTRRIPYKDLDALRGVHSFPVINRPNGDVSTNPQIHVDPLLLDRALNNWSDRSWNNRFEGTVTQTISPGALDAANSLDIFIDVQWKDSVNMEEKDVTMMTTVWRNGMAPLSPYQ